MRLIKWSRGYFVVNHLQPAVRRDHVHPICFNLLAFVDLNDRHFGTGTKNISQFTSPFWIEMNNDDIGCTGICWNRPEESLQCAYTARRRAHCNNYGLIRLQRFAAAIGFIDHDNSGDAEGSYRLQMALPTAKAILLVEPVQRRGVNGKIIAKDRCIWPIVTFWPLAHRREALKRCRFSHKIFHAISRQQSSSQCICGARAAPISTRFSTDRVLCPLFSPAITNDCERGTYILLRPTAI